MTPWSLTPGETTQVCVSFNGAMTNCLTWPVEQTAASVFTLDGFNAALNQDGTVNSASNAATYGSIVSIFATGLGPIFPAQADGTLVGFPLPSNVLQDSVYIQGLGIPIGFNIPFEVTYAGPAPYLVAGTSQINFRVSNV